jgi:hypothetical protein
VFQNTYALNVSPIFPVPSGEASFFLGSDLKPRKSVSRRFDWRTALGYQLTLSVGYADFLEADGHFVNDGLLVHRHHVTVVGHGGRRGRFYYSLGGGAWMRRTTVAGVEGEVKLGGRFAVREDRRISGVVGGQLRLGGLFDESYPLPQLGVFVGFMVF